MVACHVSTPHVRSSKSGQEKVNSAFHPFSGPINEYQACLGTKYWGFSHQTDHLTGTSAHAPQHSWSRKLRWAQLALTLMACCAIEFSLVYYNKVKRLFS
ncbi:hypothetical protein TNCV_3982201 [Trichonephila clavipes]|nr:hypothetical protein TNCV_3982201 [Trichonephila clavipes]